MSDVLMSDVLMSDVLMSDVLMSDVRMSHLCPYISVYRIPMMKNMYLMGARDRLVKLRASARRH